MSALEIDHLKTRKDHCPIACPELAMDIYSKGRNSDISNSHLGDNMGSCF